MEITDAQILFAMLETDRELFDRGRPLKRRREEAIDLARIKLGLGAILAKGPFTPENEVDSRLISCFQQLYGETVLRKGFGHGVVDFRGVLYLVKIPLIFGQVRIEPFEHTTLTSLQVETITRDEMQFARAIFQIGDAFDASLGLDARLARSLQSSPIERSFAQRMFLEGRRNFMSACTLSALGLDVRECVLSSFLAMELCVKGFLAERGYSEEQARKLNHFPDRFLNALKQQGVHDESMRIEYVLQSAPNFVETRYGNNIVSEPEAANFLFGVQYLIAELMRLSGQRSFLSSLDKAVERQWPPSAV